MRAAFVERVTDSKADIVGYMDIDLSTDIDHLIDEEQIFLTTSADFVNSSNSIKSIKQPEESDIETLPPTA